MVRLLALVARRSRRLTPLFAAALAGIASAGTGTDDVGALVGNALPAAGGIVRSVVLILGSYDSSSTACTATAIGRDLLLTAAHCVQLGADYKLVASEPGDAPVLKDIARIEREPQFDLKRLFGHLATAEVALIKLAEPLPARIPAVRIDGEKRAWPSATRSWSSVTGLPSAATAVLETRCAQRHSPSPANPELCKLG